MIPIIWHPRKGMTIKTVKRVVSGVEGKRGRK